MAMTRPVRVRSVKLAWMVVLVIAADVMVVHVNAVDVVGVVMLLAMMLCVIIDMFLLR